MWVRSVFAECRLAAREAGQEGPSRSWRAGGPVRNVTALRARSGCEEVWARKSRLRQSQWDPSSHKALSGVGQPFSGLPRRALLVGCQAGPQSSDRGLCPGPSAGPGAAPLRWGLGGGVWPRGAQQGTMYDFLRTSGSH